MGVWKIRVLIKLYEKVLRSYLIRILEILFFINRVDVFFLEKNIYFKLFLIKF